jgi:hypothetical protein
MLVRRLKTFLGLPRQERWIVMQSFLLLPLVALLLGTIGLARCWALLEGLANAPEGPHPLNPSPQCGEGELELGVRAPSPAGRGGQGVRATVRMVDLAARHLPWQPRCLPHSLVLWFLLRRQGVPAKLRIGVQKSAQQLKAHAWVEVDRQVVNDAPDIATEYRPFEDIATALRSARSEY